MLIKDGVNTFKASFKVTALVSAAAACAGSTPPSGAVTVGPRTPATAVAPKASP